jgi:hypothetical protein
MIEGIGKEIKDVNTCIKGIRKNKPIRARKAY